MKVSGTNSEANAKTHSVDEIDSMLPRKARTMWIRCPYRKPTQVGEKRIRRRSRETWLRNSAKFPRNFGRRGAPDGETTCSLISAIGGRREKAHSTVY